MMHSFHRQRHYGILGLTLLTLIGCTNKSTPYSTPENTWQTSRQAVAAQDFPKFVQCFDQEGVDELAGGFLMAAGFMQWMESNDQVDPKDVELIEQTRQLIEKYRPDTVKPFNFDLNKPEQELRRDIRNSAQVLSDRRAFAAEYLANLAAAAKKSARRLMENARLENLRIDGDTATATATEGILIKSPQPIQFRRTNGMWKIHAMGKVEASDG